LELTLKEKKWCCLSDLCTLLLLVQRISGVNNRDWQ